MLDARSVSGACHSRVARPVVASPVQMPHGWWRRSSTGSGAPPMPGRRTNATRLPSGDQRGLPSRDGESVRGGDNGVTDLGEGWRRDPIRVAGVTEEAGPAAAAMAAMLDRIKRSASRAYDAGLESNTAEDESLGRGPDLPADGGVARIVKVPLAFPARVTAMALT